MVLAAYSGADCDGRPADIAHKPIRRFSEQGRCGDVVSHLRRHRSGYERGGYSLRYVSRRQETRHRRAPWEYPPSTILVLGQFAAMDASSDFSGGIDFALTDST
jgi:hypothetical protein